MSRIALLLAALAGGTLAAPAFAADVVYEAAPAPAPMAMVDEPAPTGWSGFYLGVQGGGAFNPDSPEDLTLGSSFGNSTTVPGLTAGQNSGFPANTLGAAFGDNFESDFESSFLGGVHAGYDYQMGNLVLGVLADINALDVKQSFSADSNTPAFYRTERSLDYLATGRVRVGYTVTPMALAYVTGGVAYGEIDYGFSTDSPAVSGNARSNAAARAARVNEDEDEFGYTIGGGMEVKLTQNVSFGAEYLYTNLGSGDSSTTLDGGPFDGNNTTFVSGQSTTFKSDSDFDFHTVTAKLTYRFN
ncbi:outer membrane beta-barrel protein [Aurantimonas sp. Leaf443]|uniref:outer membrane protein n=1 Tax=Aurantimonas sp. Leaf443 TaxID=1736378 RepID=UPI0006F6B6A2|nr:outer membrane beta-barrel protein [Aurantimonas sp. Leaf443]KQT85957.1 hypothetical protein ASG48_05015 [Aurantimonas sp. Leaf443]